MTISQERFDNVVIGLFELINQRSIEITQYNIWLKERDERLATQSNELKAAQYNLVQANNKGEDEKQKRLKTEMDIESYRSNNLRLQLKLDELQNIIHAQDVALNIKSNLMLDLKATISKQRKVISKLRKQKAFETKITFK